MSRKHTIQSTLTLIVFLLVGCASRSDYAKFAEAGSTYAIASNAALDASTELRLDASSEKMLTIRTVRLNGLGAEIKAIKTDSSLAQDQKEKQIETKTNEVLADLEARYKETKQTDRSRLEVLTRLKKHNSLLSEYFLKMAALASDKNPDEIAKSLAGTSQSLEKLGVEISGTKEAKAAGVGAAVEAVGKLAVDIAVRATLADELKRRGTTIRKQLKLQEEMLIILSAIMVADANAVDQGVESRRVLDPYVGIDPLANPDKWKEFRASSVRFQYASEELKNASKSAKALGEAFEDLAANKMDIAQLQVLISDASAIYKTSQEITKLIK